MLFIVAGIACLMAALVNAFRLREVLAVVFGIAAVLCFMLSVVDFR